MSWRERRKRKRKSNACQHLVHSPPGTVVAEPQAPEPELQLLAYGPDGFTEQTLNSPQEVKNFIGKWPVVWLNIEGLGNAETVVQIGKIFSLHELALEDCMCIQQRAKVDEYPNQIFVLLKMAMLAQGQPCLEQVSLFLGQGFAITFQEGSTGDVFQAIRNRIRKGNGHLRSESADYLMYSIVDAVVDGYFPVIEALGDELEKLEDQILEHIDKYTPARILEIKRDLLTIRRAIWPTRDAVNILIRDEADSLISKKTKLYMRDCYDHAMRVIDLLEMQREICSDLMDLYLSSVSNRMNEIVKVLTIITLLFMPPTLIAGIYGMNFNTKYSNWNMPELNWPLGYPFALSLMVLTAIFFYSYVKSRGWFKNDLIDSTDNQDK